MYIYIYIYLYVYILIIFHHPAVHLDIKVLFIHQLVH